MRYRPARLVSALTALAFVGAGTVGGLEQTGAVDRGPVTAAVSESVETGVVAADTAGGHGAHELVRTQNRVITRTVCLVGHYRHRCTTRRVRVSASQPRASHSMTRSWRAAVTAGRRLSATAGPYTFMATDSKSRPAHWNRCAAVRYRVNPAGMPAQGLAEVKTAIAKLSAASGLSYTYLGATSVVPYSSSAWSIGIPDGQSADLYIAWSDSSHVSLLSGNVAGVGGPFYRIAGGREPQITKAGVTLDRGASVPAGFGAGPRTGTLLLHELGHTLDLGHVEASAQVMAPSVSSASRGYYQGGDLAGMHKLASYPCF